MSAPHGTKPSSCACTANIDQSTSSSSTASQPETTSTSAHATASSSSSAPSTTLAPDPDEWDYCPWHRYLPSSGECAATLVGFLVRGMRKDLRAACCHLLSERTGLDKMLAAVRAAQLTWPNFKAADDSNSSQVSRDQDTALAIEQCVGPLRVAILSLDALLVDCGVGLGPDKSGRFILPDDLSVVVKASNNDDVSTFDEQLLEGGIDIDEYDQEEDEGWEEAEEVAAAATAADASIQEARARLIALKRMEKPPERPRVPYPGDRSGVDLPYPPGVLEQWQSDQQAHNLLGCVIGFEGRIRDILAAAALPPNQLSVPDPPLAARGIRLYRRAHTSDVAVGVKLMELLISGISLREAMVRLSLKAQAMRLVLNAHGWWRWNRREY